MPIPLYAKPTQCYCTGPERAPLGMTVDSGGWSAVFPHASGARMRHPRIQVGRNFVVISRGTR
jgi:hypothetical protein